MARIFQRKHDKFFWIDFNDAQGRRHRRRVAPSKRVAEESLNAALNAVARQEWVGVVENPKISFADFAKLWAARVLPTVRPRTAKRWSGIVENHLRPAFKGALRAVELGAVEKYIAARLEAGANPASVNREVGVLRHLLKRAMAWTDDAGARYLTRYPLEGWKPLQENPGRTRFLDVDEIDRLLAACAKSRSRYLTPFVLTALNTGMRRGEILSLRRKSIDWQNHQATIAQTKNGEAGHVPLNATALDALRSLPVRLDGKLFPFKDDAAVSRAFRRACERAGIEDCHLHDLRHTFASHHAAGGANQTHLQALLRHRDTRMTMRYSHLTNAHLRVAVDAMNLGATNAEPGVKADAS